NGPVSAADTVAFTVFLLSLSGDTAAQEPCTVRHTTPGSLLSSTTLFGSTATLSVSTVPGDAVTEPVTVMVAVLPGFMLPRLHSLLSTMVLAGSTVAVSEIVDGLAPPRSVTVPVIVMVAVAPAASAPPVQLTVPAATAGGPAAGPITQVKPLVPVAVVAVKAP